MALEFTTIQHGFRKAHDLTCNEYVICDMVYHLSKWNDTPFPGWCYMKRESMAAEVGLSERSVITLLQKMVEAGFVELHPLTKHVRPTKKWQQVYCKTVGEESSVRVKKVQSMGEESSVKSHEESSAYTNSINKDSINTGANAEIDKPLETNSANTGKPSPSKPAVFEEKEKVFYSTLAEHVKEYGKEMVRDFFDYWAEPNPAKTKMKWEFEKTWDLNKRLRRWANNNKPKPKSLFDGNTETKNQAAEERTRQLQSDR